MSFLRLNYLMLGLIAVLAFLQYRLWFEQGGLFDMMRLKKTLAISQQENDKLKESNEQLLSQVEHLQTSKDAAESRARNELGMIKKDETFYQIVK